MTLVYTEPMNNSLYDIYFHTHTFAQETWFYRRLLWPTCSGSVSRYSSFLSFIFKFHNRFIYKYLISRDNYHRVGSSLFIPENIVWFARLLVRFSFLYVDDNYERKSDLGPVSDHSLKVYHCIVNNRHSIKISHC